MHFSLRRQRTFRSTRQTRSHRTSRLSSRSFQSVRLQNKVMSLLTSAFIQSARMSWTRCCSSASGRCKLLSAVTRLIYSLLDPAVKTTESIVATVVTIIDYQGGCGSEGVLLLHLHWRCREHFVSGCWHSSGRDCGRHLRECWLSTLGVLHPCVPVMWYDHIRDLSPQLKLKGEPYIQGNELSWLFRAFVP